MVSFVHPVDPDDGAGQGRKVTRPQRAGLWSETAEGNRAFR